LDFNQKQDTYPGGRTKLEDSLDGSKHGGRLDMFLLFVKFAFPQYKLAVRPQLKGEKFLYYLKFY
jgi:hypothetical protein